MENFEQNPEQSSGHFESSPSPTFALTPLSIEYLREVAKWARFLSILGLVGVGLSVLAYIFLGVTLSAAPLAIDGTSSSRGMAGVTGLMFIPGVIIMLIYILPIWWLYQFSTRLGEAINFKNNQILETSFQFLKKHYKFIGIFVVVILALYILLIIGAVIAAVSGALINM